MTWHKQPGAAGKTSVKTPHVSVPKPHAAKAPKAHAPKAPKQHVAKASSQRTAPKPIHTSGGKK